MLKNELFKVFRNSSSQRRKKHFRWERKKKSAKYNLYRILTFLCASAANPDLVARLLAIMGASFTDFLKHYTQEKKIITNMLITRHARVSLTMHGFQLIRNVRVVSWATYPFLAADEALVT